MKTMKKYWRSEDGQSELGSWPVDTPDETILAELLGECGTDEDIADIEAGEIVTGMWEDGE